MKSQLIVVPVAQLLKKVVEIVGSIDVSVIYVSLNKTAEGMSDIFSDSKGKIPKMFFIDCVRHEGESKDILHISTNQLEKLDYAIRSFKDEIKGKKVIVLDALSTLLIYNSENKVAGFVKKIVGYAQEEGVDVLAFTPKTEEEELLTKVFNFFDEVKQE